MLLIVASLEYVGYFNSSVRFFLFYGFVFYNLVVFAYYLLRPLMGLARIGRRMDADKAARILGTYFKEELRDKVINALQLKQYLEKHPDSAELLIAGMEQKAGAAMIIPFKKAINLKANYRILPFLILPAMIMATLIWLNPGFITEPVTRIIQYENHFERPSPFTFVIESGNRAFRHENVEVVFRTEGDVIPEEAEIRIGNKRHPLRKIDRERFGFTFRNVQSSFAFFVESQGFRFGPYEISVIQKPSFSHFGLQIEFPAYTGLPLERYQNMGDLQVTEGSNITWEFHTQGTGNVQFIKDGQSVEVKELTEGRFQVNMVANNTFRYKVLAYNELAGKGDSLLYTVQVRPDLYPRIQVDQHQDSVMLAHIFHRGVIQDDHGFTRLEFHYQVNDNNREMTEDDLSSFNVETIDIDTGLKNQTFYHHFDLRRLQVGAGQNIYYFYQVYDNDGVNGPKSSRSRYFSFYVPSQQEIIAERQQDDAQIRDALQDGMGEVQKVRSDIDELRRQMLNSDRFSWEQQESMRELLNKQREMEQMMEQLSDFKRDSETRAEQFLETNERIKEKQEELQRIFDEVLSEELRELFQKIREELDQLDRNQIYEMLNQMEFEFRDLETQMDRALELFRQLEMERMLQQSIDMLQELKEEQASLSEETANQDAKSDMEEIAEKQKELTDQFESIKEMLQDFREKNKELSRPHKIDDTSNLEQEIQSEMESAGDQLDRQQGDQARQKQQNATQKMDQLSERLQNMQQDMYMEQLAEDSRALRQILENLLKTSFAQEDLLLETRQINPNDPRYVAFIQEQRKIMDDLSMIQDSLVALSKRQTQIGGFVTREIGEINMNLERGIYHLIERQRAQASSRQQFVMTHINNLALLLNESLQNMQMQMAAASGMGDGDPNQMGEPSFQNMRQMQEQLNEMLQQMQEGHQPMPGETGQPQMSTSEAMARMAAEQEAIRRELQKMAEQMMQMGQGDMQELLDLQRDMERSELDMVRKQIGRQTMMRQQEILTRLLEHERAELQQEMEERRVGTTAYEYELSNPDAIFEYNRIRSRETDMLRSLPANVNPFYRGLIEQYFLNIQNE